MNHDLKAAVLRRCQEMEIPLVGIASTDRWEDPPFEPWMPEDFYPQSIFPDARSVIVIGLPVHLPVLATAPSIYYHEHVQDDKHPARPVHLPARIVPQQPWLPLGLRPPGRLRGRRSPP
ncbi:MAG: hypothetical protein RQM90_07560 [Methanoculleus sp.]